GDLAPGHVGLFLRVGSQLVGLGGRQVGDEGEQGDGEQRRTHVHGGSLAEGKRAGSGGSTVPRPRRGGNGVATPRAGGRATPPPRKFSRPGRYPLEEGPRWSGPNRAASGQAGVRPEPGQRQAVILLDDDRLSLPIRIRSQPSLECLLWPARRPM